MPTMQPSSITAEQLEAPSTIIVDGWQVKVTVRDGQLVIQDGLNGEQIRKLTRITPVKRLIILTYVGYVTLDAIRWLYESKISWCQVSRGSEILALGGYQFHNPTLLRSQVLAMHDETGLEIARHILAAKLAGCARNARDVFGDQKLSAYFESRALGMDDKRTIDACTQQEGISAQKYWQAWGEHASPKFNRTDSKKVPSHWLKFGGRTSRISSDNRNASDIVNSMLNFCYAIGAVEVTHACHAVGISPALGIWHADNDGSDNAFTYDLLEAIRPDCERIVLNILARNLHRKCFYEMPSGEVRIQPPLNHEIASQAIQLSQALIPHINAVVGILQHSHYRAKVARTTTNHHGNRLRKGVTTDMIIPAKCWDEIRALLPERTIRRDSRYGERELIACLVVKYLCDCPWSATLVGRANYNSARRKLVEYQRAGLWDVISKILREHGHLDTLVMR